MKQQNPASQWSKVGGKLSSSTPVFFMELGYIIAGSMIVFGRSTLGDVMVVFAGIMAVAVIVQWAVVGVTAAKHPAAT